MVFLASIMCIRPCTLIVSNVCYCVVALLMFSICIVCNFFIPWVRQFRFTDLFALDWLFFLFRCFSQIPPNEQVKSGGVYGLLVCSICAGESWILLLLSFGLSLCSISVSFSYPSFLFPFLPSYSWSDFLIPAKATLVFLFLLRGYLLWRVREFVNIVFTF